MRKSINNFYILIANSSKALLYKSTNLIEELELMKTYTHADSRKKGIDLVTDGPGHYRTNSIARGAYSTTNTPHQVEAEFFGRLLVKQLNQLRKANQLTQLIVIASPYFHGLLNKYSNAQVKNCITQSIEKDYTKMPQKKLWAFLKAHHIGSGHKLAA